MLAEDMQYIHLHRMLPFARLHWFYVYPDRWVVGLSHLSHGSLRCGDWLQTPNQCILHVIWERPHAFDDTRTSVLPVNSERPSLFLTGQCMFGNMQ